MPLASEKAKEGGAAGPPITTPGVYQLRAAWVSEEKQIKTGENAGKPTWSVCWEDVDGAGAVWDNVLQIDAAWPRLSTLYLATGSEDANFDSVEEQIEAILPLLEAGAKVYAECGMGKASPGYPAKIEIKWFYMPEEGEQKLAAKPDVGEEEAPF